MRVLPPLEENRWREVLLEAADEGLLILGESAREAIYFHLQKTCSLAREDIPNQPDIFALGLEKIFGRGAKVVEESIVKSLYSKLGIRYKGMENARFTDYLNDAREHKTKRLNEYEESVALR